MLVAQRPWTSRDFARFKARRGTLEDKFWVRVQQGPECWLWLGGHNLWGYGVLKADGRTRSAHRISWEIHNGPIPDGLQVCHQCDVRDCVRPSHLFLGTHADNMADMDAKGRRGRGWKTLRQGEDHQAARLSNATVAAIREAIKAGESQRGIARRFGISHTYVGKLARGELRIVA